MIDFRYLAAFAKQSNEIESITSPIRHAIHKAALETLLKHSVIDIEAIRKFVAIVEPSATYRAESKVTVWIGGKEGLSPSKINSKLVLVLAAINSGEGTTYKSHLDYQNIHPFTDCNGRSGRAIWLWQKHNLNNYTGRNLFLQEYYYDTFR